MAGQRGPEGGDMYGKRDFHSPDGPSTYRDPNFMDTIVAMTRLPKRGGARRAVVLDAMSGPGLVGRGIREQRPNTEIIFLDKSQAQLDEIPPEAGERVLADVREIPDSLHGRADVVAVRYGIKDLRWWEQPDTLSGLAEVLIPGGRIVVADMVAPSDPADAQNWLIGHHALKQDLQGRPKTDGQCYIPTEIEWKGLLENAGFEDIEVDTHHTSNVTTNTWVNSGQIDEVQRGWMDEDLLSAPDGIREVFKIERQDTGLVKVEYPLIVVGANKPL